MGVGDTTNFMFVVNFPLSETCAKWISSTYPAELRDGSHRMLLYPNGELRLAPKPKDRYSKLLWLMGNRVYSLCYPLSFLADVPLNDDPDKNFLITKGPELEGGWGYNAEWVHSLPEAKVPGSATISVSAGVVTIAVLANETVYEGDPVIISPKEKAVRVFRLLPEFSDETSSIIALSATVGRRPFYQRGMRATYTKFNDCNIISSFEISIGDKRYRQVLTSFESNISNISLKSKFIDLASPSKIIDEEALTTIEVDKTEGGH